MSGLWTEYGVVRCSAQVRNRSIPFVGDDDTGVIERPNDAVADCTESKHCFSYSWNGP